MAPAGGRPAAPSAGSESPAAGPPSPAAISFCPSPEPTSAFSFASSSSTCDEEEICASSRSRSTSAITGTPSCAAVINSSPVIRNAPSPASAATGRSGLPAAIAVGTQGRWRPKKVRVRSRKGPLGGSEKANQKSAVATSVVWSGVN